MTHANECFLCRLGIAHLPNSRMEYLAAVQSARKSLAEQIYNEYLDFCTFASSVDDDKEYQSIISDALVEYFSKMFDVGYKIGFDGVMVAVASGIGQHNFKN